MTLNEITKYGDVYQEDNTARQSPPSNAQSLLLYRLLSQNSFASKYGYWI